MKLGVGLLLAVLAIAALWPVTASEIGNIELQEDLKDLAAQAGTRVGFQTPKSDAQFREAVVEAAARYGIALEQASVTVERNGETESQTVHLAAEYARPIRIVGIPLSMHFTARSP